MKGAYSVIAVLALLAVGAWYISVYVSQKPLTSEEDAAVRAFVADYGTTLGSDSMPTSIEVSSVTKTAPNSYIVEGSVAEVATTPEGTSTIAAIYSVTLKIKKKNGAFAVVSMDKGAYSQIPQRTTLVGYWECVPRRTGAPADADCIRGIAKENSDGHVIIEIGLLATSSVDYADGDKVRVTGILLPADQLNTDRWQSYDIDAIISATAIEKLK